MIYGRRSSVSLSNPFYRVYFIEFILSSLFYRIHCIESILSNSLYRIHFIEFIVSNPFYRIHFIESILSNPFYRVHFIESFYRIHLTSQRPRGCSLLRNATSRFVGPLPSCAVACLSHASRLKIGYWRACANPTITSWRPPISSMLVEPLRLIGVCSGSLAAA
jgi:hypothetical protein